jgi:Repeat of unknown function (DUF5648)/Subtilase family
MTAKQQTQEKATAPRELIVMADTAAELRAHGPQVSSLSGMDVTPVAEVLAKAGARLRPLFGASEERVRLDVASVAATGVPVPDLAQFYRVDVPAGDLDGLAAQLRGKPGILAAYVKPPTEPADLNDMTPLEADAPPLSPDFGARQGYLGAAPAGVDAQFAWTQPGGTGAGIRVIDVEGGWNLTHEDHHQNQGGIVCGTATGDAGWVNHGTAVLGEIGADRNAYGVTGIAPDAFVRCASIFPDGSAAAIRRAADLLTPGDVILIELHRPGPRATGVGQQGYIAIEWWPDDFAAIQYATARGLIVVEAAGNGAQNLDDPVYDTPAPGFPAGWSNPFRRGGRDSGALLVGAGAPPPGTHGQNWGPDRSRLDFSNYGAAVDAQGWGREVTTCGYGDLQGGTDANVWYTDRFSGTSSASPIVVGSVACLQGVLRARGGAMLTPATARALLRETGSPQADAPGRPATQRIGSRPDLRAAIARATGAGALTVPLFRYWNPRIADHFYTTAWSELGGGQYGWVYEGIQCRVYPRAVPGTVPLYRYWNPTNTDHFYTTNWAELGTGRYGYRYEGVQCWVLAGRQPGFVPLYRYWNARAGDHFYTTSWAELGGGASGWVYEGIQCWVRPATAPLPMEEPTELTATAPTEAAALAAMAPVQSAAHSFERIQPLPHDTFAPAPFAPGEMEQGNSFMPAGGSFAVAPAGDAGEAGQSFRIAGERRGTRAEEEEGAVVIVRVGDRNRR